MAEESKIYDRDGKLVAVRHVEDFRDGKHVTTQEAWVDVVGIEHRGAFVDDRDVYPDKSEYEHKGKRVK